MTNTAKQNELIFIIAQAFYGNRTGTEIRRDEVDSFLQGILTDRLPLEYPVDRSVIRVPGTDNLVILYNRYQEEDILQNKERIFREEGYVLKPFAVIPELDIELYSRCFVCRMNEDGELESLQRGDSKKFIKYLAM